MTAAMSAVSTMADHMHCDKPGEEQHPDPILRKPFHDCSFTNSNRRLAISLVNMVSRPLRALHRTHPFPFAFRA
jgi:hypothetical protein